MKSKYSKMVIAHRGASGLVKFENTLEAFEKAIEVGADSIECDIRRTKDNVIIINHDPEILGLTIKDQTYEKLNEETTKIGYHLPTLKEALNLVKGKILIDIEIKEVGYEDDILKEILSVLNIDEFYVRSFYDSSIIKIKELNKDVTTVLLLGVGNPKHLLRTRFSELFPKRRIKKTGCDIVSPYYKLLINGYCKRIHKLNKPVLVWGVNTETEIIDVTRNKGADGVITNYPDLAISIFSTRNHH